MEFAMQPIQKEIEIDGFHSIYYFEFDKNFSFPPERHDFWEMMYVDSGEVYAITGGHGRMLSQGQLIFQRPMELHAHISNQRVPNNMLIVSFTSKSLAMEFFDKKIFTLDKTQRTLLSLFMKEAQTALGKIPNEYSNKNPLDFSGAPAGSVQLLACYLLEFLLVLKRSNDTSVGRVIRAESTKALGESSITELIVSYLKESVYENVTVSDICAKFFIGKSHLCNLFAEHVGEGPIEYFAKLKIAEAKRLLRIEELSITAISDMLSFSSIHNFSRAFKRIVGFSPSEYRKQLMRKSME